MIRDQRGASLLEALIGALVLAVGLLGTAQWQWRVRTAADLARQQSEAVHLAQQAIERSRLDGDAAQALEPAVGSGDDSRRQVVLERGDAVAGIPARPLQARVRWIDRLGEARVLRLDGIEHREPPAAVLALTRPVAGLDAGRALGRHAAIPREATPLDVGRSVLKPRADRDVAWVFDDRTGRIVAHCTADTGSSPTRLAATDLRDCRPLEAVLLSGRVRRSGGEDTTLDIDVTLERTDGGTTAECHSEAVRVVAATPVGNVTRGAGARDGMEGRTLVVPVNAASPADVAWADLGDRHRRYLCAVPLHAEAASRDDDPSAPPRSWSGRLRLALPPALALRACRYSADTDMSGAIDRPAEHPSAWASVRGALAEQNLLLVDVATPCPTAPAATAAQGLVPWSQANPATVPLAP